jgi:hypothetical protein
LGSFDHASTLGDLQTLEGESVLGLRCESLGALSRALREALPAALDRSGFAVSGKRSKFGQLVSGSVQCHPHVQINQFSKQ